MAVNCIRGDGAGEFWRSVELVKMLADRSITRRSAAPRTPQSNGIAERAIQQLTVIARSQLVKSGGGEELRVFTVVDAAFKTSETAHEYPGREILRERLKGKILKEDQLRAWGVGCYVHQHQQQRETGPNFHPYARRVILVR